METKKIHISGLGDLENTARSFMDSMQTQRNTQKGASVIAMEGELGAGKTTFVQMCMRVLGYEGRVASPTFVIERVYRLGDNMPFNSVHHIDLYRLDENSATNVFPWSEVFKDKKDLFFIEWPGKIDRFLPTGAVKMKFTIKNETERIIEISCL